MTSSPMPALCFLLWLPLSTSEGLCSEPPAPEVVWENSSAPSKGVFGDSSCFPCSSDEGDARSSALSYHHSARIMSIRQ